MDILIVDDSPANIEMLELILTAKSDDIIHTATSAAEGFELIRQHGIQLAIIDWMMPEVTGLELARMIREQLTDYYVYLIMVTAREGKKAEIEGLESGVDDFVQRPFSPREIRAHLNIGKRIINLENELNRSRDAIESARHEWEATSDAISQLVCLVDRDGRIMRVNQTVQLWGLAFADKARDRYLHEVVGTVYTDFARQLQGVWEVVRRRVDDAVGFEFFGDDLSLGHHFHVQVEPIEHQDDRNLREESYAAVSIHDITERRKLEMALEEEHQRSEQLLLNVMPEPVSARIKAGEQVIADEHEAVSVLFSDLVGFTAYAAQVSPKNLIELLNEIFSEFDALTEIYGLEKIKTIGDSYMAVCGLPVANPDHATATVDMGLAILDVMSEINARHGLDFGLRVGIHSGAVIAGVIGVKRFAYDLWGDTVNMASRIESTGEAGKVHISEATAQLLPETYYLTRRTGVRLKGIGERQTYFVERQEQSP
ncbi:MAG: adenylate/guanylate cyclase domain-containing protein [Chloroflexota bacterium]